MYNNIISIYDEKFNLFFHMKRFNKDLIVRSRISIEFSLDRMKSWNIQIYTIYTVLYRSAMKDGSSKY